jgi:hypothetical protein
VNRFGLGCQRHVSRHRRVIRWSCTNDNEYALVNGKCRGGLSAEAKTRPGTTSVPGSGYHEASNKDSRHSPVRPSPHLWPLRRGVRPLGFPRAPHLWTPGDGARPGSVGVAVKSISSWTRGKKSAQKGVCDLRFRFSSPVRESKAVLGPVCSCPHGPKSRFHRPGVMARMRVGGKNVILIPLEDRAMAPLNCAFVSLLSGSDCKSVGAVSKNVR